MIPPSPQLRRDVLRLGHPACTLAPEFVWLASPSAVFLVGAGFAAASLLLSQNIPSQPAIGNEAVFGRA